MQLKGEFKQRYTLDGEQKELLVEVELRQREGLHEPRQSIWYAVVRANDKEIDHAHNDGCVNAQYQAEAVGVEIIEAWKARAKKQGKTFRLKHDKKKKTRKK